MTVLNFPPSPELNATYTENNVVYTWNGNYWEANNTGSLDNIYVEVAGDSMTGNLLLPGGGGNTAALQKQEITELPVSTFDNDSGYITSSDIPPGTVSYWKKDGSELKPVSDTDNVEIGRLKIFSSGTLHNGVYSDENSTAIYNGNVSVVRGVGDAGSLFSGFEGYNSTLPSFEVRTDGTVHIGGLVPASPNITLNADGSAVFQSNVQAGTVNLSDTNNPGVILWDSVGITSIVVSGPLFRGYGTGDTSPSVMLGSDGSSQFMGDMDIGGTTSSPNITLAADGTANFATKVASGTADVFIVSATQGTTYQGQITYDSNAGLKGYAVDFGGQTPIPEKWSISRDGSAEFGKASALGGATIFDLQTGTEGGQLQVMGAKTGSSFVSKYVSGSNGHHFIGKYDDDFNYIVDHLGNTKIGGVLPADPNISLNAADGSGLFTGNVNVANEVILDAIGKRLIVGNSGFNSGLASNTTVGTKGLTVSFDAADVANGTSGVVIRDQSANKDVIKLAANGLVTAPKLNATQGGVNCFYDTGKIAYDTPNFFVVQGTDIGVYLSSGQTAWQPTTSERRLKENIVAIDVDTAWETIKSTPYYSYNFIGVEATNYGPMADEVPTEMVVQPMEENEAGVMVARSDEEGPIRTYDNGMLQARLYTALQTALTRIETLEAEVNALKGA